MTQKSTGVYCFASRLSNPQQGNDLGKGIYRDGGKKREITVVYWGYTGIMENTMEIRLPSGISESPPSSRKCPLHVADLRPCHSTTLRVPVARLNWMAMSTHAAG